MFQFTNLRVASLALSLFVWGACSDNDSIEPGKPDVPVVPPEEIKPEKLVPLTERVNVQSDSARFSQLIQNEWVAVGINRDYAIQQNNELLFQGKPSYRFELKDDDNSLEGYNNDSKGRAELCYCFATDRDFKRHPEVNYSYQQLLKTVYFWGKGSCEQGAKMHYTFSVNIPADLDEGVHTIFAQWHGMPSRTVVYDPTDGKVKTLTDKEFIDLEKRMVFKNDTGYDKIYSNNGVSYEVSKHPNGWKIEQGGYPPMAFGITDGYFYIQANSDKKWMSDKDERCNINPSKAEILDVRYSKAGFKSSTLAYKLPMCDFPRETWVTFDIDVDWSMYVREKNEVAAPGMLDIYMSYEQDHEKITRHIVDHASMDIGRNDDKGYYFKFGIYRTSGNTVPLHYHLAGYSEKKR